MDSSRENEKEDLLNHWQKRLFARKRYSIVDLIRFKECIWCLQNNRHDLGTQPFNTCSNRYASTINHKCQLLRNMQLYTNIQNNFLSFASHCNIFSILKCFCNFPSFYGNKLITQNTFTCSKSTSYCHVWGLFWYYHTVYNNKIV